MPPPVTLTFAVCTRTPTRNFILGQVEQFPSQLRRRLSNGRWRVGRGDVLNLRQPGGCVES